MNVQDDVFPKCPAILNAALLVLLTAIVSGSIPMFVFLSLGLGIGLLILFAAQRLIWAFLHSLIQKRIVWTGFLLAPSFLLAGLVIYSFLPSVRISSALEDARLANLPGSAHNVQYHQWSGIFSGESFLSFQAVPDEIEEFLAASPSLQDAEVTVYSANYQRVPYPEKGEAWDVEKFDYFSPSPTSPAWWKGEIKSGRAYEIPAGEKGNNWGVLLLDDHSSTVFILVVHG